MSESSNNGESIDDLHEENKSNSSIVEDGVESNDDEIQLTEDGERPIDSYASMIYFKDKSEKYSVKEEPSSPDECKEPGTEYAAREQSLQQRTATVTPSLRSQQHSFGYGSSPAPSLSSSTVPKETAKQKTAQSAVDGAPIKPLTPYMSYRNMLFKEIKHKYPGDSPYDLACLISSKWSTLTDSERKVWEDQYEEQMKKYNEALLNVHITSTTNDYSSGEKRSNTSEAQLPAPGLKGVSVTPSHEAKPAPKVGPCKWCRQCTYLQDFSSVIEGREIYCTGLCSEKCFVEAAKQINHIEGGSEKSKQRYFRVSDSQEHPTTHPTFVLNHTTPTYVTAGGDGGGGGGGGRSSGAAHVSRLKTHPQFDWEQYLSKDAQSTSAHWTFFRQARHPPVNSFAVGMKMEACSYNAHSVSPTFSLATVIVTCGSRLLLNFEGSDPSSGIWRLPDSEDIHPVGWTEGSLLKAPKGYKYDPAKYNKYFATSLQNAEIAPARFFKKEPKKPMENYFTVGMKLEAVDKSNPSMIGVASVVDVEGEQIKIEFDGYKGIGYWCHYYDRDIFPAGWCARAGHPLRPPGNKVSQTLQRESLSSPPLSMASMGPKSPHLASIQRESASSTSTWKEKNTSPNSVEVFINGDCYCGPYIELAKLKLLPRVYSGNMVKVLKNILEDVITCAIDPKTVFGFLKPGRGNCVIKAICDGVAYQCCLNSIDRVSTFWRVLEQFSDNLRCCPNMFSSTESRMTCTRCNSNRVRSRSTVHEYQKTVQHEKINHVSYPHHHSSYSGNTHRSESYSRSLARPERLSAAHAYSMSFDYSMRRDSGSDSPSATSNSRKDSVFEPPLLRVSHTTENMMRQEKRQSEKRELDYTKHKNNDVTIENVTDEPKQKKMRLAKRRVEDIDITSPPKTWSIDDVILFIQQTDLKDYVSNFRENEIDGKALLLLERDLVLSHMGFKLGPAVKLLGMIDELKSVQESFS